MAIRGISLKCPSASCVFSIDLSDIDDDIIGTDPVVKAGYWIGRTLEDIIEITYPLEDMIESWLRLDSSRYLEFTIDGLGQISLTKKL